MIRLVLAVRVRIYREALLYALASNERALVVAAGWCFDDLIRHTVELSPDVLVLDYAIDHALTVVTHVRRGVGGPRVIAVGVPDSTDDRRACELAGVAGIVPEAASLAEFAATVEAVSRLLDDGAASILPVTPAAELARLTRREIEIVRLIAAGLPNRAIATQLHIELSTVKNHVHAILEKLNVNDRNEAAQLIAGPMDAPLTLGRI